MNSAKRLAGVVVGGRRDHVEIGMGREEPEQLSARVPTGARDGNPIPHAHYYA